MKDTVFYERVLKLCSEKGISVTALAEAIGKQASTASGWKKGAVPRADTLRQVADYFGVSTGYLTGDESVNVENVHTNNGIIGHAHAPVTIVNGSERNEKYIGVYKWNDVVIEGGVPSIIDKALFMRVQEKLALNKKAPARAAGKVDYLLSTKLFCGKCGTNMNGESGTSRTKGRKYHYYKCANAKRRKGCNKKPVRKDWIEDLVVIETVRRVLIDEVIEVIADKVIELQGRERDKSLLHALEMELEGVKKSIANLVRAVEAGIFSGYITLTV